MKRATEMRDLSRIANGDDETLAILARTTMGELRRLRGRRIVDTHMAMDVFHWAWDLFARKYDGKHAKTTYAHYCVLGAISRVVFAPRAKRARYGVLSLDAVLDEMGGPDKRGDISLARQGTGIYREISTQDDSVVEREAMVNEEGAMALKALDRLEPRTREIVRRHCMEDETYREIAVDMGTSHQRVQQLCAAGLSRLRHRYMKGTLA